jgi:hypothetical protein
MINRLAERQLYYFNSRLDFELTLFQVPKRNKKKSLSVMIDWRSHRNPCSLTDPCYVQYKSRLMLSFTKKSWSCFVSEVIYDSRTFPLIKRSIKAGSFNYKKASAENLMTLPGSLIFHINTIARRYSKGNK